MKNDGCGYDPCPCRGVNFISGYYGRADYCVDGKRVTLDEEGRVMSRSASDEQVFKLGLGLLARYADYCIWHSERVKRFGGDFPPLSPFGGSYPLERWNPNEDGGPDDIFPGCNQPLISGGSL